MYPTCKVCGKELIPADARWDGEPTTVGFNPCPDHPGADVEYRPEQKPVTTHWVDDDWDVDSA